MIGFCTAYPIQCSGFGFALTISALVLLVLTKSVLVGLVHLPLVEDLLADLHKRANESLDKAFHAVTRQAYSEPYRPEAES